MALNFCDGCDQYSATSDLGKKWRGGAGAGWSFQSTSGFFGGGALRVSNDGTTRRLIAPTGLFGALTNSGIFHLSFFIKISATHNTGNVPIVLFANNSLANFRGCLGVDSSGRPSLHKFDTDSMGLGAVNIADNQWHHIELRINGANSSQTQTLYCDRVQVINVSATYNGGAEIDTFCFTNYNDQISGTTTITVDDVFAYDDTGSTIKDSNYPLLTPYIKTLRPNGDSAVQFTRSTGSDNYALVDESGTDNDDTDYVEDGTSSEQDLYDYENLGFTPSAITAVVANATVKNPGAGSINYKQICKSNATQTDGASTTTSNAYAHRQEVFPVDPNTSAAWEQSGYDSAKFGIKVV